MAAPPLETTVDIAAVRVARPGGEELSPRTRLLLEAAIPQTLLRLAAPNGIIIAAQAALNVLWAAFVVWAGGAARAARVAGCCPRWSPWPADPCSSRSRRR